MTIKKRMNPPPKGTAVATFRDSERDRRYARNPFLTGIRQDVYEFVRANQPVTRDDVSRGLAMKSSTATARIKELIDEGYLIEPGERKENSSGVRAKVLVTSSRPKGGRELDKVRVEVTLTIDCNGNYGAIAKVVGGQPQARARVPILRREITLKAPHPDTFKSELIPDEAAPVERMESEAHYGDIIEGTVIDAED